MTPSPACRIRDCFAAESPANQSIRYDPATTNATVAAVVTVVEVADVVDVVEDAQ
jgi:hypothetical protein